MSRFSAIERKFSASDYEVARVLREEIAAAEARCKQEALETSREVDARRQRFAATIEETLRAYGERTDAEISRISGEVRAVEDTAYTSIVNLAARITELEAARLSARLRRLWQLVASRRWWRWMSGEAS